jgi:hypothetical protein
MDVLSTLSSGLHECITAEISDELSIASEQERSPYLPWKHCQKHHNSAELNSLLGCDNEELLINHRWEQWAL